MGKHTGVGESNMQLAGVVQPMGFDVSTKAFADELKAADAVYYRHNQWQEGDSQLEQAMNAYSRLLETMPSHPAVAGKMARIELKRGNLKKAAQWAEKALALDARNTDAIYTRAVLDFKKGALLDAQKTFAQGLQVSGFMSSGFYLGLFQTMVSRAQETKTAARWNFYLTALVYMALWVAFYPLDKEKTSLKDVFAVIPRLFVIQYHEEAGRFDQALEHALKLSGRYPGLASLSNTVASLYRKKGLPGEAMFWFHKTLLRHPANEDALYHMAQIFEERNEHEDAVSCYEKLLAWTPNEANLMCLLGNAYYVSNDMEKATAYYKGALHLGRDKKWCALLAQSLGNIYNEYYQNPEAAKTAFQMAIDLNPAEVENYIQLGLLHYRGDDYANAQLVYEAALKIDANNPRLYSNLGYLRWMQDDLAEAVQHYEASISKDPFYEIPYNNLAVIHLDNLGNVTQAIELLNKAVSLNESYALAYYNLGRAYSFMDDRLEAAGCFQKAQELNQFTRELDNEELTARINHLFS